MWARIQLRGSDSLLVGCISHLLICGDFNFKEVTWSELSGSTTHSHVEPFLDSVDDLFLFQHVNEPTRIRQGESPSLIDLVFTNE